MEPIRSGGASRRATAIGCAVAIAAAVAACGGGDTSSPDPTAPELEAPAPASPPAVAAPPDPGSASPTGPSEPPCAKAPCAARPIVFVHGHNGSNDDWQTMVDTLVSSDDRFDAYRFLGTQDHAALPTGGIARRAWLFAFDYYVARGTDKRGSYTAGPGKIGSDSSSSCASPQGTGHLVADGPEYDSGVDHEFAADLASMVGDVLRATGAKSVDLVAHSLGGLVSRSYLAFFGGNAQVEHLVLLASPHLGVPLAPIEAVFGRAQPWMKDHELAELDSGALFPRSRFVSCGAPSSSAGSWTQKLLEAEIGTPIVPDVHVMSGSRDILINYKSAHHHQAKSHVVVQGVDHPGILKAPSTIARVSELCGGTFP